MFSKIYDALIYLGTPNRWHLLARRMFVLLWPITIPLLIAGWVMMIAAFIGLCILGGLWCILMEFINSMRMVWERR
jgi:ABC-type transport system involved in cytochrome c biogenesis permease component